MASPHAWHVMPQAWPFICALETSSHMGSPQALGQQPVSLAHSIDLEGKGLVLGPSHRPTLSPWADRQQHWQ